MGNDGRLRLNNCVRVGLLREAVSVVVGGFSAKLVAVAAVVAAAAAEDFFSSKVEDGEAAVTR